MSEPQELLKAEHLKKIFAGRDGAAFEAVRDLGFSLKKGECLGIVGESGSGKSTVARMITRLLDATEGKITFLGEDISELRGKDLHPVYRKMQMVFQMPQESFDPRRTLGDGIGESLRNQKQGRAAVREKVSELLKLCGLDASFAARYPHEVSGGECQRAAIARALAQDPVLLICDEATSALDVTVQKQIMELLEELKEKKQLSLLFICHDLALVQSFCDRILVMHDGRIVEEGTPEEVIWHPKQAYTRQLVDAVL